MCVWVGVWVCGCVYKIEKFRTLSAPSEIALQFPPPLRSKYSGTKMLHCVLTSSMYSMSMSCEPFVHFAFNHGTPIFFSMPNHFVLLSDNWTLLFRICSSVIIVFSIHPR
jgi:hypothetical protein